MTTPKDARPRSGTSRAVARDAPFETHRRRERRWGIFLAVLVPLVAIAWLVVAGLSHGTVLTPHADVRIEPGQSLAWAATTQLAWDRLASRLGGTTLDVRGADDPEGVRAMNRHPFPSAALDRTSFVAIAGDVDDHPARRFLDALTTRFGKVPEGVTAHEPAENAVAAFAYLEKTLRFATPFPRLEDGLRFGTGRMPLLGSTKVEAFGFEDGRGDPTALAQAVVHWQDDPRKPERFVLELTPSGGADRIVLGRVDPEETLARTWDVVSRVAAQKGAPLAAGGFRRLAIPTIDTGALAARFDSLLGGLPNGGRLEGLAQWLRVRIDETGARVSAMGGAAATTAEIPPGPSYVFDAPFLVGLTERGAAVPCLLLWIGNADLLVRPR